MRIEKVYLVYANHVAPPDVEGEPEQRYTNFYRVYHGLEFARLYCKEQNERGANWNNTGQSQIRSEYMWREIDLMSD